MAFDLSAFVSLASVGGPQSESRHALHWYTTNDTAAAVETAGYFNDAAPAVGVEPTAGYLQANDVILAVVDIDGTPQFKMYRVVEDTPGAVTVNAAAAGADDVVA